MQLRDAQTGSNWFGLELLKAGKNCVPEKFFFDRINKYSSKVFTTSFLGEVITCFCSAPGNKFLFLNHYKYVEFSIPPTMMKIFPYSNPEDSRVVRQLTLSLDLPRFIGIVDSMTRKHFEVCWDNKNENEAITVYPIVKNHLFAVACKLFIGIENDPARIDRLLKEFITVINGFVALQINFPGTKLNRAVKAATLMRKEIVSIIEKRKAVNLQPLLEQDDVLSHMIPITKYLAELPDIYDAVRSEQMRIAKAKGPGKLLNLADLQKMKYSWNVACEALRLAPPAHSSFRTAITDFTYAGYFIPKGRKICMSIMSTHKDPECFTNPEKFDPSRFEGTGPAPYSYVPFGGGPHNCPGKQYAKMTMLVFMHHWVTKYKWRTLLSDPDDVGKLIFNPFPLPKNGLPILLQPNAQEIIT
ncbi:beta-amyrin 28-monooxygenase-like [Papaver somniferum]|uniref:beta-amyrin 28-monooxygenase-like n=1 Tax=Papaver somniferum TaxID=3469 RepID=UPI000E705F98|nr:beta-amyrin 28-monooxygenase-like [Papaver somniferum]